MRTDEWVCLAERKREDEGREGKRGERAKERKNPMATEGDMYQPANTKITQCKWKGRVEGTVLWTSGFEEDYLLGYEWSTFFQ